MRPRNPQNPDLRRTLKFTHPQNRRPKSGVRKGPVIGVPNESFIKDLEGPIFEDTTFGGF
jgi:hypothetical protein